MVLRYSHLCIGLLLAFGACTEPAAPGRTEIPQSRESQTAPSLAKLELDEAAAPDNPAVGKEKALFLSPEVRFHDQRMFYNGEPFGHLMDGCCGGQWHFPINKRYTLECDDGARRDLRISFMKEPVPRMSLDDYLSASKSLSLFLDGEEIAVYATRAVPDEDGLLTKAEETYALADFFKNVQRADMHAYRCTSAAVTVWLDVERELSVMGGFLAAASREQFILKLDSGRSFAWITDANMQTPESRVAQGREFLFDGAAPEHCPVDRWPCDADERSSLERAHITEFETPSP
ncbi:hypothetical protein [Henriciella aquimarina]|uniref:hypothetical protein n=1 Tax=Henriciella aquimarina TaxID=545261 RepID=UPI0009FE7F3A|nr:hypothetical protein [Henriciella aquimarina]